MADKMYSRYFNFPGPDPGEKTSQCRFTKCPTTNTWIKWPKNRRKIMYHTVLCGFFSSFSSLIITGGGDGAKRWFTVLRIEINIWKFNNWKLRLAVVNDKFLFSCIFFVNYSPLILLADLLADYIHSASLYLSGQRILGELEKYLCFSQLLVPPASYKISHQYVLKF